MINFAGEGLGLRYGAVRLVRAEGRWGAIATELAAEIRGAVNDWVESVEHVGSSAVPGMMAKPILDLAVGARAGATVDDISDRMSSVAMRATTEDGSS